VAKKTMLVNACDPEEIRVAILLGRELDELYVETSARGPATGSIYKGRVDNYERSLEAAFVDVGFGKHGFLHASDASGEDKATRGDATGMRSKLKRGRELLVQVKKESIGGKGPALTMFVGLPGRYLVLMPSLGRIGVSRRIRDRETREALKGILAEIETSHGEMAKSMGFVIRTEAKTTNAKELRNDVDELLARWQVITERAEASAAPALLWEEADLTVRALRDHLASDTSEIWTDTPAAFERTVQFIEENAPELKKACKLHDGGESLFERFGVEGQMEALSDRKVKLPSGGYLLIEHTEAMAVVDVNSGRTRHRRSSAAMIRKTNVEAAREVTRQLRLRDIGGLIVVDFIDMEELADRKLVEDEVRKGLERDKARTTVLAISELGILEMTRQRRRLALEQRTTDDCPVCSGRGLVRSTESLSVAFLRELRSRLPADARDPARRISAPDVKSGARARPARSTQTGYRIVGRLHPERALEVANHVRSEIAALEANSAVEIVFQEDAALGYGRFEVDVIANQRLSPRLKALRAREAAPGEAAPTEAAPSKPEPAKEAAAQKKKRKKRRGRRGGKKHRKKKKARLTSPGGSGR
jgi:ribonuclease E